MAGFWNADSDRDWYDEARGPYLKANATCSACGTDFHKGHDDTGSLCDTCCDERDALGVADGLRRREFRKGAA